ncbi:LPXTG cell wall anchor domain-containing protein [Virgibacillus saliphilus]|uniref:LPXTG cell wall anchor domain-containing protein n=1 Tax=Virgibacillus saliphilus TaxID=2831674 RepID=UPI002105ECFB|nr:LPXTG cell wall anchor domain-containing protein [Virgibacillus sp. NKC19-3]
MKANYYETRMSQNRKRYVKNIAGLTMAATIALSVPVAPNVLSNEAIQDTFGTTVVHAAVDNILEPDDQAFGQSVYFEDQGFTNYAFHNNAVGSQIDIGSYDALNYVFKLPDEMSYIAEDPFLLEGLKNGYNNSNFSMTGTAYDEDNNDFAITSETVEHPEAEYITVNQATNSIEFDLYNFLQDNGFVSVHNISFSVPVQQEGKYPIPNGEYTFQTALVASDNVDLNNVDNADTISFTAENSEVDPGDGDDEGNNGDDNSDDSEGNNGDDNSDDSEGNNGDDNSDDGEGNNGGDNSDDSEGNNGDDNSDDSEGNNGDDNSDDGKEPGSNDEDEDEDEDENSSTAVESDDNDNGEGGELPQTATSTFNWLLGGFMALMAGTAGLFTRKKKGHQAK